MSFEQNSALMRFFGAIGMRRTSWSLRRLHCPVDGSALVLEVGSGGNPYARANVLVDAYEETRERHWDPLVHDRPTVLANGEKLPFKDKAFDFVLAVHVLEHTTDPKAFLAELQRVARAGYIETPDAFMERINPYKDHRLEVTVRDDRLVIRKKAGWVVDPELVGLYERRAKRHVTRSLIPSHPDAFHVRYYWSDTIEHTILNPEVDANWTPQPVTLPPMRSGLGRLGGHIRLWLLRSVRALFSQTARNKSLDVLPLLRCPSCGQSHFARVCNDAVCGDCKSHYGYRNGVLIMASEAPH